VLQLVGALESGIVAESDAEATLAAALCGVGGLGAFRCLALARRQRHLPAVGLAVVGFDVLFLALMPVIWMYTQPGPDPPRAFMLKNELFTVAILLVGVNALALSPRYPAIMTAGAVVVHLCVMAYAMADPRVAYTGSFEGHFTSAAVNLGIVQVRIVALTALGAVLWFVTRSARRLVRDAVMLEAANQKMRDRQAQLLAEGRMSALASLVSGIAHELNSPLGAVRSSLDTVERCVQRLSEAGPEQPPTARVLRVLGDSVRVGAVAVERISGLSSSLKRFARLDEAEVQRVDVREGLQTTLSLLDDRLRGAVTITTDYQELPLVWCRPSELNQVFYTLAVNALEALDGHGELRVAARQVGERICVEFADSGPGIAPDRVERLFEIGLEDRGDRVGMGLGLVTGRRIVERHGGELTVDSTPGRGTTFRLALPLRSPLESRA
jgi:signal transduction histidine kinase